MKREILFKAKRVDNNEWVEGCLVNNLWTYNEASDFPKGTNVCEIITGKYSGDCWEDISTDEDCIVSVNPETVCQFTGKLDVNKNKIFENDVVQYSENPLNKVIVVWDKRTCGFVLNTPNYKNEFTRISGLGKLKVVSNIHDK